MKKFILLILLILFSLNLTYSYKMEIWVKRPDYAVIERYSAESDYSDQQGYRNWFYQYKTDSYYNMGGYGSCWAGSSGIWAEPPNTCCLCLWSNGGHPGGDSKEAVRTWKSPRAGIIYISGLAGDNDPGTSYGSDGVYLFIRKNNANIWSLNINNGEGLEPNRISFGFFTSVATNDYIRFAISPKSNPSHDNTYFNPTIEYVNGVELARECTSIDPNFNCNVTYSCDGKPGGTYYAQARTFYDDGNLASESEWTSFNCNPPPQVISVTPNTGLYYNVNTIEFTAVYRDDAGANDIDRVYFAISPANYGTDPSGDNEDACCRSFEGNLSYYFGAVYNHSNNQFRVAKIDTGGCPWGNPGEQNNKYGTAKLLSVSHQISGNELRVTWKVEFTNFPTGDMNLYLMVVDKNNQGNNPYPPCIASWVKKGKITFYGMEPTTTPPTITTTTPSGQTTTTTPPVTTTTPSRCYTDADCPCYANCINGQCVDFRSLLGGCNYYDNCRGDQNCCSNNQCNPDYCANVDEEIWGC